MRLRPCLCVLAGLSLMLVAGCGDDDSEFWPSGACADLAVSLTCTSPRLHVEGNPVYFDVEDNDAFGELLRLQSVGSRPVEIVALEIVDDETGAFGVRVDEESAPTDRVETSLVLAEGTERLIQVVYRGVDPGRDQATLQIVTNESDRPPHVIELETIDARRPLRFEPDLIDAGVVEPGAEAVFMAELSNTHDADVTITGHALRGSVDLVATVDLPATLPPGATLPVTVSYAPLSPEADAAVFEVDYTFLGGAGEAVSRTASLEIFGNGPESVIGCLQSVALGAQSADAEGVPVDAPSFTTQLEVEVGATVQLDGTRTYDPDGDAVASWAWRVVGVPSDFVIDLRASDQAVAEVRFLQPGVYAVALDVADAEGETSCEPGRVEIEVVQ